MGTLIVAVQRAFGGRYGLQAARWKPEVCGFAPEPACCLRQARLVACVSNKSLQLAATKRVKTLLNPLQMCAEQFNVNNRNRRSALSWVSWEKSALWST